MTTRRKARITSNKETDTVKVLPQTPEQPALETPSDEDSYEGLFGSSTLPSMVVIGGEEVTLGFAVLEAFKRSGLSFDVWNDLDPVERDAAIVAVIDPATDKPVEQAEVPTAPAIAEPVATIEQPVEETVETVESFLHKQFPKMVEIPKECKNIFTALESYMDVMSPKKPQTVETGMPHQRGLYYTMLTTLALPGPVSRIAIEGLLWYFHTQSGGAFKPTSLYRFINSGKMLKDEVEIYNALVNLFTQTANRQTRRDILRTQVKLSKVAEKLKHPKHRENLLSFYM